MLSHLINTNRNTKRAIAALVDTLTILLISLWVNSITQLSLSFVESLTVVLLTATAFVVINVKVGLYRAVLRYAQTEVLQVVFLSSILIAVFYTVVSQLIAQQSSTSALLLFAMLSFAATTASRFGFLALIRRSSAKSGKPVVIYGAGSTGRQLISSLREVDHYNCVAFVDDNPHLWRLKVEGVPVYAPDQLSNLCEGLTVAKVLLAIPSASSSQRRTVLKSLEAMPVEVMTVPSLENIVSGDVSAAQLSDVSIADLLGRASVAPESDLLNRDIRGKSVMVTGAGGSIGSELCRQIIAQQPKLLVLFELSEYSLYRIHQEVAVLCEQQNIELHTIIGSVQSFERVNSVMSRFSVQTVYHAAAYKHVPLVEQNIMEGVRNNVLGTFNVAKAAHEQQLERCVLISTDKAVRPTNVMGASKRFAELVVQGFASRRETKTVFSMVRFGNVLGSSGSVVPRFKDQINSGGPITLTHREITRYFMTIPEASQLVIQAGAMAKGGEVFVLHMGEPVKIFDLAVRMIRFSGLEPSLDGPGTGDIDIQITGLRKGEKLYEELLVGDNARGTAHPKIMCAVEAKLNFAEVSEKVSYLNSLISMADLSGLHEFLQELPLAFTPVDPLSDELFVMSDLDAPKPLINVVDLNAKSGT